MSRLKIQHVKLFLLFFVIQTDKNHISNDQINFYLKDSLYGKLSFFTHFSKFVVFIKVMLVLHHLEK